MNSKILSLSAFFAIMPAALMAQRHMDSLDRGLVAMQTPDGVFCSWRINADEWTDSEYNIYKGGIKLNNQPLKVSNFLDTSGSADDQYTVVLIKNGVETETSSPVSVWEKNYTVITPKHSKEIKVTLVPNDATAADVDGDGQLEIIMKYDTMHEDFENGDDGIFTVIECLEMDGTVKWWINMGPNAGDFQNNEINIAAYDWDLDGRAEIVFRAADATMIHLADGTSYTIGDPNLNYREGDWPGGQWFMRWGKEYLVYADGLTGKPYECIEYPLKRVEDADNPKGLLSGAEYDGLMNKEWGDGYGHRSSKYFFAAPYLDGRKPSLFLARGIYTKHKMIAYDIDPASHRLIERWRWNDIGGDWFAQGYHNMGIADVDWDGRDEIVFGSMVIDDNGYGLSTTGLGHGDAQHCGDFDPYSHGQEIFACNEHHPNNNFRDATTSKIYYRSVGDRDDGRANMGNFIDKYPGAEGISSRDNAIVCGASHNAIIGDDKSSTGVITQNFRVYWDGDQCDESFDYGNGKNTAGTIFKPYVGVIATLEGSKTNNDTKGTPCFQGDILGDWREEYIMRDADNNIRIYTTDIPTPHRIYSLWYDHQYRNAMVWQMCGYNQPPHVSFHLSSFEGMTIPPAPLSIEGKIEIPNGGFIGSDLDGKNVLVCETNDMTLSADDNIAPDVLTFNTPSWVQGHNDNNNITSHKFTHRISSGSFTGDMTLIKQGDGKLILPSGTHSYNGPTEVWAGTLGLDGELSRSNVWLNRFSILETSRLNVRKGISMEYASVLRLGSDSAPGSFQTGHLMLGFGSIIEIDVFANGDIDKVQAETLTVGIKDWKNGPEYLQPLFKLTSHVTDNENTIPSGKYFIGEIGSIVGDLDDIILLGMENMKKRLVYEDGKLYLELSAYQAGRKIWSGVNSTIWDLDNSLSFIDSDSKEYAVFVPGDEAIFDDSAVSTDVVIEGRLMPSSVTFDNDSKDFTLSGSGQIVGDAKLVKNGSATLSISNINQFTGATYINGGKLIANSFANDIGSPFGALSDINSRISISNDASLAVNESATLGQRITLQTGNAAIEVPEGLELTLSKGITAAGIGQTFTKKGKVYCTLPPGIVSVN